MWVFGTLSGTYTLSSTAKTITISVKETLESGKEYEVFLFQKITNGLVKELATSTYNFNV